MPTRKKFRPTRKNFKRKRRSIRGGSVSFFKGLAGAAAEKAAAARTMAKEAAKQGLEQAQQGLEQAQQRLGQGQQRLGQALARRREELKFKNCEELINGRMVKYNDNFYYVSSVTKNNDKKEIINIKIINKEGVKEIKEIKEINEIKPYNYGDILDKIKNLTDIILHDKYLIIDVNDKDKDKINDYIQISKYIESIMKKIKEVKYGQKLTETVKVTETVVGGGGNNNRRSRFSVPIRADAVQAAAAKAKSNTTVKALPRKGGVKNNRRSRRHAWVAKGGQNKDICINDPNILGRLVKFKNNFYYVSEILADGNIKIKNKEGEQQINNIEPYNYDEVISSLLSLFKIILEKKYLYNNDEEKNNMDKMDIIQEIIKFLKLIKNPKQGSGEGGGGGGGESGGESGGGGSGRDTSEHARFPNTRCSLTKIFDTKPLLEAATRQRGRVVNLATSVIRNSETLKLINCEELKEGRMVTYENDFYYVSNYIKDNEIIIKNKGNEHNINDIKKI